MNGHLKEQAVQLINDPKATQHQKLNAMLAMLLDNSDAIQESNNANPFNLIPITWRKRAMMFVGAWMGWITLNVAGYELTPGSIWDFISDLIN